MRIAQPLTFVGPGFDSTGIGPLSYLWVVCCNKFLTYIKILSQSTTQKVTNLVRHTFLIKVMMNMNPPRSMPIINAVRQLTQEQATTWTTTESRFSFPVGGRNFSLLHNF
jgi:hypothetical protein